MLLILLILLFLLHLHLERIPCALAHELPALITFILISIHSFSADKRTSPILEPAPPSLSIFRSSLTLSLISASVLNLLSRHRVELHSSYKFHQTCPATRIIYSEHHAGGCIKQHPQTGDTTCCMRVRCKFDVSLLQVRCCAQRNPCTTCCVRRLQEFNCVLLPCVS